MGLVIIPSPAAGYVELASTGAAYPRFRKHILNLGELNYQGQVFKLDDNWYAKLKDNFNSGVSMCQVPLADAKNRHSEYPLDNTGEIVGLEREGKKVFTVIEVRKPKVVEGLRDKTIMGASALLSMDYTDTRTGKKVGPALLHHCLTNRPYVLDLDPYEEIVAATVADMDSEEIPIVLSGGRMFDKDELIRALKDEHGIDVTALQAQAGQFDTAALTAAVAEALRGTGVALTAPGTDATSVSLTDVTGAIVELAGKNQALTESVGKLQRDAAEREVEALIGTGRLLPKTRAVAVELALTNREQLDAITAPADAPYVVLSAPVGRTAPDGEQKHEANVDEELLRLTSEHPELFSGKTAK